jgi:hypothetical protein
VGTAVLLLLALFGNWLLPWERWTDLQRDAWIGAVIVAGFTMILTDKRASL